LCEAFARGAGGRVVTGAPLELAPGPAAFYDVRGVEHLWRQAIRDGRTWYYMDNAYFDAARDRLYRAARNAVQADGLGEPDWARWRALGINIGPWQRHGTHVLICAQSDDYLSLMGETAWTGRAVEALRRHTDRPIIVRRKNVRRHLAEDLRDAWAVVTFTSSAAIEALLAGIPAFCTGRCAASPMGLAELGQIEHPRYPEDRERWAAGLAAAQWSIDEIAAGVAWHALHGRGTGGGNDGG